MAPAAVEVAVMLLSGMFRCVLYVYVYLSLHPSMVVVVDADVNWLLSFGQN